MGMDPRAQPFRPRGGEGEGGVMTREDLEGEEEWCLLGGREGIEWNGSESGGSSFKGDGGSLESSEREDLREEVVVGGELHGRRKGGESGEKSYSEVKNEDSGDD